jgi:hypothetical protein
MDDFEARAARWRVRHLSSFDMAHDGVILGIRMALSQAQASCSFRPLASIDEIFALQNRGDGHPSLV